MSTVTHPLSDQITIRRLGAADADALRRLAELDSSAVPAAPLLGAEHEGRLVAATSLLDAGSIADPFLPTAAAVEMLELRAAQLRTGSRGMTTDAGRAQLCSSGAIVSPAPASCSQ